MSAKDIIIFFFWQKVTTKYMSYFTMFNEKVLTKQLANDESRTIKRSGGTSTTSVDCTRCNCSQCSGQSSRLAGPLSFLPLALDVQVLPPCVNHPILSSIIITPSTWKRVVSLLQLVAAKMISASCMLCWNMQTPARYLSLYGRTTTPTRREAET